MKRAPGACGTIARAGEGFIGEARRMPGVEVIAISREDRDELLARIAARLTADHGARDA